MSVDPMGMKNVINYRNGFGLDELSTIGEVW